jgi:hypothetical protein
MELTEEDRQAQRTGKLLLFLVVGAISGLLLWFGVQLIRQEDFLGGGLAAVGSALFWYPLFRLGRYHARKRQPED